MPYEDFTGYTEADPNNHISLVGTDHIDFDCYRNEDAWLYYDYGAAYFTDWTMYVDFQVTDVGVNTIFVPWAISNTVDDVKYWRDTINVTGIWVYFYHSAPNYYIKVEEDTAAAGVWNEDSYITAAEDTWYYLTLTKSGTALNVYIYDDSERLAGDLLDTLTIDPMSADHSFRYIFAANTYNSNTNVFSRGDIENLAISPITLSGVTRDSGGTALASCTVWLFRSSDKTYINSTTSNAVTGAYSFNVGDTSTNYFIRSHKDGAPNVFGTTDDDLVGT